MISVQGPPAVSGASTAARWQQRGLPARLRACGCPRQSRSATGRAARRTGCGAPPDTARGGRQRQLGGCRQCGRAVRRQGGQGGQAGRVGRAANCSATALQLLTHLAETPSLSLYIHTHTHLAETPSLSIYIYTHTHTPGRDSLSLYIYIHTHTHTPGRDSRRSAWPTPLYRSKQPKVSNQK